MHSDKENEKKGKIPRLINDLKDLTSGYKDLGDDIDKIQENLYFPKERIYKSTWDGNHMIRTLDELYKSGIEDTDPNINSCISKVKDHVAGAQNNLNEWNAKLKNIRAQSYIFGTAMSESDLNMSSGMAILDEVFYQNRDIEPYKTIFPKIHKVNPRRKKDLVIKKLSKLDSSLAKFYERIELQIVNQSNITEIKATANLIVDFMSEFSKYLVPSKELEDLNQEDTLYNRIVFAIIGKEIQFQDRNEYRHIIRITSNFRDISNRSNKIKHKRKDLDLTTFKVEINIIYSELQNYIEEIIDLRDFYKNKS